MCCQEIFARIAVFLRCGKIETNAVGPQNQQTPSSTRQKNKKHIQNLVSQPVSASFLFFGGSHRVDFFCIVFFSFFAGRNIVFVSYMFLYVLRGSYFFVCVFFHFLYLCCFVFVCVFVFYFVYYFSISSYLFVLFVFLTNTNNVVCFAFLSNTILFSYLFRILKKCKCSTSNCEAAKTTGNFFDNQRNVVRLPDNHERLLQKTRGPASHPTHINAYQVAIYVNIACSFACLLG